MVLAATSVRAATLERMDFSATPRPTVRLHFSAPATGAARTLPAAGNVPGRIYVDVPRAVLAPDLPRATAGVGPVLRVRVGQLDPATVRVVVDLGRPASFSLRTGARSITLTVAEASAPPDADVSGWKRPAAAPAQRAAGDPISPPRLALGAVLRWP